MKVEEFLKKMTPELYRVLRQSLEEGKWPDGQLLMTEQKDAVLQALIIYEHKNIAESERIGYMPVQCKSKRVQEHDTVESIIRFKS